MKSVSNSPKGMNKKLTYLFFFGLLAALRGVAQESVTYLSADFTDGLPEGSQTYDLDGQKLYFTMVQAGFDQGDAWKCLREEGTQNYYAASASKYKVAAGEEVQPANDWLVLPAVRVYADNATLQWRANSLSRAAKHGDRYEVRVSETGNRPEDFTQPPLLTIEEENLNQWTARSVSLSAYAGKEVYVAFVNTTLDGEILGIDDVLIAGAQGSYRLQPTVPPYVFDNEGFRPSGRFEVCGTEAVTAFKALFRVGGETFEQSFSGLSLQPGDSFDFSIDRQLSLSVGDTLDYVLSVQTEGDLPREARGAVVGMLFPTTRRTVIEEATGMWCVYCPLGIVAMERLRRQYPESFIGVAVHYEDKLSMDDYVLALEFPGFPSGWINRRYMKNPMDLVDTPQGESYTTLGDGFETWFLAEQERLPEADLQVGATVDGRQVRAEVKARFAQPGQNDGYRLFCVAVEDSVTADGYYQDNGFAGSPYELDGFENQPQRISPFVFQEVARAVDGDYLGQAVWSGVQVKAGDELSAETQLTLPADADVRHTAVVALLIDGRTGHVVNAARCALESDSTAAGIHATEGAGLTYHAGSFSLSGTEATVFNLYAADGRQLAACHCPAGTRSTFRLPSSLPAGTYVLEVQRASGILRAKFLKR